MTVALYDLYHKLLQNSDLQHSVMGDVIKSFKEKVTFALNFKKRMTLALDEVRTASGEELGH